MKRKILYFNLPKCYFCSEKNQEKTKEKGKKEQAEYYTNTEAVNRN